MKKMDYVKYETPQVEVIEVEVEKRFAVSDGVSATNPDMDM